MQSTHRSGHINELISICEDVLREDICEEVIVYVANAYVGFLHFATASGNTSQYAHQLECASRPSTFLLCLVIIKIFSDVGASDTTLANCST